VTLRALAHRASTIANPCQGQRSRHASGAAVSRCYARQIGRNCKYFNLLGPQQLSYGLHGPLRA